VIEVNLLPGAGGRKRRSGGGGRGLPKIKLPDFGNLDPWVTFVIVAWVLGPALFLWLFLGIRHRAGEAERAIEQAVADSARYAAIIESTERLRARRDTIAQKLEIIQDIDAGRYIWAHILDEVSRAIPEHTWLTALSQTQNEGGLPTFRIEGRAGNNFVLTRYMNNLEASPFLRRVRLSSTTQAVEDDRIVHAFVLEARYQKPPPELIETVPLLVLED
jgi:Tfp pilus assembly protein PilN